MWIRELIGTIQQIVSLKFKESNMENPEDQESTSESINFLLAYVSSLIPIGFSTLYTAETERIWIFMAPFILIPTAKHLKKHIDLRQNHRIFTLPLFCFLLRQSCSKFSSTLYGNLASNPSLFPFDIQKERL